MANDSGQAEAIMQKQETCDRADTVVQRMNWKVAPEHRDELKAHIRIALDTEVAAGGPYLNNGWNGTESPKSSCQKSREPKMGVLRAEERAVIEHALGIPDGRGTPYLNNFCADPTHSDMPYITSLVQLGFMRASHKINDGRDTVYVVTDAGREALNKTI